MSENEIIKVAVIVEDQPLQDYIVMLLVGEGYEVKTFSNQNDAIINLDKELVELIILEYQSPNINGLDICKVLRKKFFYNLVPMFFVIPDEEPLNVARLMYAGADDYIKKALVQDELFLKIKLNTYRITRQQDMNPITKLPGQAYLLTELQKRIESQKEFAVSYLDIYKFREYAYRYGFEKANTIIKYTAELIFNAIRELGNPLDFIAHIQSNEFIFLTSPESADNVVNKITTEFDQNIPSFYDAADKTQGYVLIKNRIGQIQKLPFLKVRIGVVVNTYLTFFNPTRIIQIVGEIKDSILYLSEKSVYKKEERRGYAF